MWNTLECAAKGRSHFDNGTPCQDKTYSLMFNDAHVIALADGAGSAKLSQFGAEKVTRMICEKLAMEFEEIYAMEDGVQVKNNLINEINTCLLELSKKMDCDVRDLASTLLFVALKEGRFIMAHIGDGVIGYSKDGHLHIASEPENGEFINTTVFTTSNNVISSMKLIKGVLGKIEGFVLMSDGTEESLYNRQKKALAPVIMKIMTLGVLLPKEVVEKQLSESFENTITKATMDDCSIAMIFRNSSKIVLYDLLSYGEKYSLLCKASGRKISRVQMQRFDQILTALVVPESRNILSRKLHLKQKYLTRYLQRLEDLKLIELEKNKYKRLLRS